ncbi:DUF362 domain-containing protein [Candidatus Bathyarchaeota archaeon]|nr:DUF362 domain-containing protein [Candidatus Bathyarchaeota archaeon]
MENIVALVRARRSAEEFRNSVSEALKLIDFEPNTRVKCVAIKPNLCYYWDADTGYTTDPAVVAGIVDWIREKCGENVNIKVVEADASAMRTKYAFPVLGYEKLAKEKKVELLNLSEDVLVDKTVKVNGREISFKVPRILLDSDLFINVPKLKIMKIVKITCAMKNIFGCIGTPRKVVYHKFLDEAIVGINKILHPHLTIVDGIVALGRHPLKLGLLMAGTDPFAVDWVASQIMGYKPSSVKFLKIAVKEGLGNPNNITLRGERVSEFAKIFPKEGMISTGFLWSLQFWLLKTYRRLVGDVIPPVLEE